MARRLRHSLALALAVFVAPGAAARACENDLPKVGYLGISDIECDCTTNFTLRSKDGQAALARTWQFRSEPVVGNVIASGPSAGKLKAGDVITAVDGALITTREGSARFSNMQPGQTVRFTVRRDGRDMPVVVKLGEICPEELTGVFSPGELIAPRAPQAAPSEPPNRSRTPRAPRVERVAPIPAAPGTPGVAPTPPLPGFRWMGRNFTVPRAEIDVPIFSPEALPAGWLGIGLRCQECGGEVKSDEPDPVWRFGTLPMISFVDPEGPSARAGLRRGDQLTHIDGISLVTEAGGKRFGSVKPGQAVKWRVIREGKPINVTVTAVARPGDEVVDLTDLRDQLRALRESNRDIAESREMQEMLRKLGALDRIRQTRETSERRLRYAGSVGGSDVEVRGLGTVVVDDSGDEIVIVTRDATIRIRPGEKTPRVERRKNPDKDK